MKKMLRLLSRISVRLMAFNVLLVFLPITAFLTLDTYEQQLLQALEHALVQQARILSSALSGQDPIFPDSAEKLLEQLRQRHEARLRVVDERGRLVADSSRLGPRLTVTDAVPADMETSAEDAQSSLLYRIASFPIRLYRRTLQPPQPAIESGEFYVGAEVLLGEEVLEALQGRYGATTRISTGGQRSVTLYSAVPVFGPEGVSGAVLVSQSTYRILRDLYVLRLEVFQIFLISLTAAVIISLLISTTISRPLQRLRNQAREILDHRGRLTGHFRLSRQPDEIGDLSLALQELTLSLDRHIRFVESFASDVSHEFKNPLASIRSATEMALQAETPEDRARFLAMIQQDVARMGHLLNGVREISQIDAQLGEEDRQAVDIHHLVALVVEGFRLREPGRGDQIRLGSKPAMARVYLAPERLSQIVENLLVNALDFSPPNEAVDISVRRQGNETILQMEDRGPGIPEQHLGRIFDRFFTFRPQPNLAGQAERHNGLGLAIVKALAEGYGGSITAVNRPGGGACFRVSLPLYRP